MSSSKDDRKISLCVIHYRLVRCVFLFSFFLYHNIDLYFYNNNEHYGCFIVIHIVVVLKISSCLKYQGQHMVIFVRKL